MFSRLDGIRDGSYKPPNAAKQYLVHSINYARTRTKGENSSLEYARADHSSASDMTGWVELPT